MSVQDFDQEFSDYITHLGRSIVSVALARWLPAVPAGQAGRSSASGMIDSLACVWHAPLSIKPLGLRDANGSKIGRLPLQLEMTSRSPEMSRDLPSEDIAEVGSFLGTCPRPHPPGGKGARSWGRPPIALSLGDLVPRIYESDFMLSWPTQ